MEMYERDACSHNFCKAKASPQPNNPESKDKAIWCHHDHPIVGLSGRSTLVRGVCAADFPSWVWAPFMLFRLSFAAAHFFSQILPAPARETVSVRVSVSPCCSPPTRTPTRGFIIGYRSATRPIMSCVVCVSIVAPPPRPRDRSGWLAACVKRTAALFCGGPLFHLSRRNAGRGALEILNVRLGTATQKKTTHKADWPTTPAPHTHGKNRLCASAVVPGSRCGSGVAA